MSTATLDAPPLPDTNAPLPPAVAPPAPPPAPPEKPWLGQQWEYRTFRLAFVRPGQPTHRGESLEGLNDLGAQGWEVVGVGTTRNSLAQVCVLKRPRPDAKGSHSKRP